MRVLFLLFFVSVFVFVFLFVFGVFVFVFVVLCFCFFLNVFGDGECCVVFSFCLKSCVRLLFFLSCFTFRSGTVLKHAFFFAIFHFSFSVCVRVFSDPSSRYWQAWGNKTFPYTSSGNGREKRYDC